ncbi:50S ribosomal protein L13 [soil metagenome]
MKTFSAKPTDVTREWYIVDASEVPLGRLATQVAQLLTGKGKPQFTKNIACGDYVVVINAEQLQVTGKRLDQKMYYHHSHYPGGLKEISLKKQIVKDPTQPVIHAIRGMLPINKLRDGRLARLKVYAGADHKHDPQQPKAFSLKEGK